MKKRKKIRFKIGKFKKEAAEKNKGQNRNLSHYNYKIGNRNIKLTVERLELVKKSDLTDTVFYYSCVFCSKDFDSNAQACPECGRPLVKINLKKCAHCGAKNNPSKQNCWVCNEAFPKLEERIEKESRVLLTLNIGNCFYRNTDKILGLGMHKLFDDLIAANFSREPLEAWIKLYEGQEEFQKEFAREECRRLAQESKRKSLLFLVTIFLPVIILAMLFIVFWVK